MTSLEKILYVEDDQDIREISSIALQDIGGFNLKICESGAKALEEVDDFLPQLILLDVMMPGMDGPTTLEALRNQGSVSSATVVVFMTAKVHSEDLQRYREIGVNHVISKPFDPMTLADKIREIWSKHHG
ncbi:Response regulator receiver domain-containing protein [Marinospirillum celere]|uniref:Response regulator receiver domain-containing protein n=1 Tax=Marinospirillum celere TaxID=1122252 RepID=A0A1I1DWU5_9GAMM|nr:response regulator [Marinospirillum celere]SFB79529.1 Response regulator receiver domain-containing protein [Marinospirillum celere]